MFDEEDDETREELERGMQNMQRIARRSLLKKGDLSKTLDNPIEQIFARMTFALAENQEQTEQEFGEDFTKKHKFNNGGLRWISEPEGEQATLILIGVLMSISNTQTMIDLINDLGFDDEHWMKFAKEQINHIKRHQEECIEAVRQAKTNMDSGSVLEEVESILTDVCNHCHGPLEKNARGDSICPKKDCFFFNS